MHWLLSTKATGKNPKRLHINHKILSRVFVETEDHFYCYSYRRYILSHRAMVIKTNKPENSHLLISRQTYYILISTFFYWIKGKVLYSSSKRILSCPCLINQNKNKKKSIALSKYDWLKTKIIFLYNLKTPISNSCKALLMWPPQMVFSVLKRLSKIFPVINKGKERKSVTLSPEMYAVTITNLVNQVFSLIRNYLDKNIRNFTLTASERIPVSPRMRGKVNQWTSIYCESTAFLQQPIVVVEQQSFSINLNNLLCTVTWHK